MAIDESGNTCDKCGRKEVDLFSLIAQTCDTDDYSIFHADTESLLSEWRDRIDLNLSLIKNPSEDKFVRDNVNTKKLYKEIDEKERAIRQVSGLGADWRTIEFDMSVHNETMKLLISDMVQREGVIVIDTDDPMISEIAKTQANLKRTEKDTAMLGKLKNYKTKTQVRRQETEAERDLRVYHGIPNDYAQSNDDPCYDDVPF